MTKSLLEKLPEDVRDEVNASFEQVIESKRHLEIENRLLHEQIRLLKAHRFGRSSEQLPGQGELFDLPADASIEEEETVEVVRKKKKKKTRPNHPGRHPFPDHLERVVEHIQVEGEERTCSNCGNQMATVDEVIEEELEEVPAKLRVRQFHREVCACPNCTGEKTTAEGPSRLIPGSSAGPSIQARVIVDKFADHLPLNRQEKRFNREGVYVSRKTQYGWLKQLAPFLGRLAQILRADLLAGHYIQADETPVSVLTKEKTGRNDQDYFWVYHRPGGPIYIDFRNDRSRDGPAAFLKDYMGFLQRDGYSAYLKVGLLLIAIACMAHIRRKFWEAFKAGDLRAQKALKTINWLYKLERHARDQNMNADERYVYRKRRSARAMRALKQRILRLKIEATPASALGKACDYALSQWEAMENYLTDGRIEIDNNLVENVIRPITLGRKNWLHLGSECAGDWAATYMTLIANCHREQIDPKEYLTDVITRMPDHDQTRLHELTPHNWKVARMATVPEAGE